MKHAQVRRTRRTDLTVVAEDMRQADRDEVAVFGYTPYDALYCGWRKSDECWTVLVDGLPVAVFGVTRAQDFGVVWALGTDALTTRAVIEVSREYLPVLAEGVSQVGNVIDARNTVHVEWLKKMGFRFTGETLVGPGLPFLSFAKPVEAA